MFSLQSFDFVMLTKYHQGNGPGATKANRTSKERKMEIWKSSKKGNPSGRDKHLVFLKFFRGKIYETLDETSMKSCLLLMPVPIIL